MQVSQKKQFLTHNYCNFKNVLVILASVGCCFSKRAPQQSSLTHTPRASKSRNTTIFQKQIQLHNNLHLCSTKQYTSIDPNKTCQQMCSNINVQVLLSTKSFFESVHCMMVTVHSSSILAC